MLSLALLVQSLAASLHLVLSKEIRLGVLMPMTGRWPIGTRTAAAVPMAISAVMNDSSLLPGYNISFRIEDSSCEPEQGLRGIVGFQSVDVFIGPACSVVAEPVALLAKIWKKPIITYAASSNKFIDKNIYSTLATITAYARRSERYTPAFVFQILKAFKWTIFAILSSSEVEWKTMAGKIRSVVESHSIKVSLFETYDNKNPEFETLLTKGKNVTRVFLILCYINEVVSIMETAKRLGMTNGEYAFITLDLNTDVFYKNGQWTGNEGKDSSFSNILNGIIDLSVYRPELSMELKQKYRDMGNKLEASIKEKLYSEPSWYASFVHDSVHLYSLAVNDTISCGYDITNTSEVLLRMFNRRFQGESGYVFMENGTRIPEFVIGNFRNGSYKFVGDKTSLLYNGTGSVYHEIRLRYESDIRWPGGSRTVPVSNPVCGFTGKDCNQGKEEADHLISTVLGVLGGFLLLISILIVLIFAKRRMDERENVCKKWIISYKDITPSNDNDDHFIMRCSFNQLNCQGSTTSILPASSSALGLVNGSLYHQRKISKGIFRGKVVSIKLACGGTSHLTESMKAEIRQACEVRHINLNPYIGFCAEFPDIYIVSEHCAKGSLQDILLRDDFKLDWTFRMSFALDIARGMEELHKTSIGCHSNLKSTNVLVDSYWICKVADYGLQTFRENRLHSEETLLTQTALFWTAPECLRTNTGNTPLGDVYSYGIILQEIALREKPFSTSLLGPKEILYYVRKGIAPHCRPQVPPDSAPASYMDLMKMCWDERPERRPTFCGVLKILKRINNGKTTSVVDSMLSMMEKYTNNLETIVNERTKQLQSEKTKTDELLHRMLPRSIADHLKAGLEVKAEHYDNVTIFYSDMVEFSNITSHSSPIQVITLLNDLHSLYDTVMTRYDVYKAETSSDSCMVVSGLPERNGNKHAGEIASMALRLVAYLKTFKISHMQGTMLQFRIGIHTGPCVAGVVGLKKPRYDIFGETVDITRQMEETGTAQKIHVSSTCKSVLDELGGFSVEERGLINIMTIHRGLVARGADKAVQQINRYPADKGYQNLLHYPPDRDLFSG